MASPLGLPVNFVADKAAALRSASGASVGGCVIRIRSSANPITLEPSARPYESSNCWSRLVVMIVAFIFMLQSFARLGSKQLANEGRSLVVIIVHGKF